MSEWPSPLSDIFRRMAERIDHNCSAPFGGAAVVVLPSIPGVADKTIDLLLLGSSDSPAQFLATLQTRIQIMIREMEDARNLQQAGWGRG